MARQHMFSFALRARVRRWLVGAAVVLQTLLLAAGMAYASTAAVAVATVGEATLVIGQARITGADGAVRDAQRGAELRVGDRVETQGGAHMHIRFVDGARVSVRPGSRLLVEQYAEGGAIKFRLDEGVVRSITGAWGEAARDRFRLNTPVAAIGVKGTDFVVRSSGETTAASVFTGAIVVAPLTGSCAATVGPCVNGTEKLLSADMKGQMVEVHRDQLAPRLVPAVDLLAMARQGVTESRADSARTEVGRADAPRPEAARADSARLERPMAAEPARADLAAADKPVVSERLAVQTLALATDAAAANAAAANAAAAAAEAARNSPAQALIWVRNPWAVALAGDDFTRRFDDALAQGTRVLGTDGAYSLRRPEPTLFAPQGGSVAFRLDAAAMGVMRDSGRQVEPVRVDRASLQVDFGRSSFATEVLASGPVLGAALLQSSGSIDAAGAMRSSGGNTFAVGGFNGDGNKAGLLLRREVPGGVLQGVTLWGR